MYSEANDCETMNIGLECEAYLSSGSPICLILNLDWMGFAIAGFQRDPSFRSSVSSQPSYDLLEEPAYDCTVGPLLQESEHPRR